MSKGGFFWLLPAKISQAFDALHIKAQSGVVSGDSRFARFPAGNHHRLAFTICIILKSLRLRY
jgi:hypothetical protein